MTLWGALAGGAVGTIVLTSGLRVAQELGFTRMDIPLLLGTIFTDRRGRASVIGYADPLRRTGLSSRSPTTRSFGPSATPAGCSERRWGSSMRASRPARC